MQPLTPDRRDRAIAFVLERALPLDRALCRYHLLGGGRDAVLAELASLQNEDGGFRGMEPDFTSEASSVVNTLRALEILEALGVDEGEPIAARAVDALLAAYVPAWRSWRLVPPHDNRAPHAPWWHWTDDFDEGWGLFADNPRPSAVAALHAFPAHVDAALLDELTQAVVERAGEVEPSAIGKDALECYLRFAATPAVPRAARESVLARLPQWVEATLVTDPEQWGGYGLQPLDLADSPASPLAAPFRDQIERHLDYAIETQGADGAWSPHWSWMGTFPEAWEEAKVAWQGILTVTRLRQLTAFGRLG